MLKRLLIFGGFEGPETKENVSYVTAIFNGTCRVDCRCVGVKIPGLLDHVLLLLEDSHAAGDRTSNMIILYILSLI